MLIIRDRANALSQTRFAPSEAAALISGPRVAVRHFLKHRMGSVELDIPDMSKSRRDHASMFMVS